MDIEIQESLIYKPVGIAAKAKKRIHKIRKAKCLNPVDCWICGLTTAKDGVLSSNLVFSPNAAMDYFRKISSDDLVCCALMEKAYAPQPCGKCFACRMRKRKDMSTRLVHELKMHESACFITLTYDDEHIPVTDWRGWKADEDKVIERGYAELPVPTLLPADVQLFIKRLRRHLEYVPKKEKNRVGRDSVTHPIRYFAVGEYGGKTHRPHYHIIVYGWYPSDAQYFFSRNGHTVNLSKQIQSLWKFGHSSVGEVSPAVARYCARYVTKKYADVKPHPDDWYGDVRVSCPEFTLQSVRNGGIGAPFIDKYYMDIHNGCIGVDVGSRVCLVTVPKYYTDRLRKKRLDVWLKLRDEKLEWISDTEFQYDELAYEALLRACECEREKIKHETESEVF